VKKSAVSFAVISAVVFTSLVACDAIKDDLSQYSKTAVPVYNNYAEKLGEKFVAAKKASGPEAFLANNREITALLDDFRIKMEAIKPETREVQDLNQDCIANLTLMEDGSKQLGQAIEKQDTKLAEKAKAKIEDALKADERFRKDLKAMEEKHNVLVKP
jgi:hypothetical protein